MWVVDTFLEVSARLIKLINGLSGEGVCNEGFKDIQRQGKVVGTCFESSHCLLGGFEAGGEDLRLAASQHLCNRSGHFNAIA